MLTKVIIENFKRFGAVSIELGPAVVFVGPNNSGKTSALQALALWELGVRKWLEKRGGKETPEKRPGVTINRKDLFALPVPTANLLWRDLHVRTSERSKEGKTLNTQNIRILVTVEGVAEDRTWTCGLEFDYANEESFYCRPRLQDNGSRMAVPEEAARVKVAFLPPMSGLRPDEERLDAGTIQKRIGEGRTAEVLRNLCWQAHETGVENWARLVQRVRELFGDTLDPPILVKERGEVVMSYQDLRGARLDLSSAGRGLQQTLLLLAWLQANPSSVLLLDEPDAHLEILRQRQIYRVLTEAAREQGSQILAATHSEVLLNEAADRDIVVAFVGRPHRIDDRGSQALKSLVDIGFEQFYQAEQTGWVLYLEGPTDLAVLQAFAETLDHPSKRTLERPFVHYVGNHTGEVGHHFFGLKEALPRLVGFALFDHLDAPPDFKGAIKVHSWKRREVENYLAFPEALQAYSDGYAADSVAGPLFTEAARKRTREAMEACIRDLVPPIALKDPKDSWWTTTKASDEFLDRLFEKYFKTLGLPNLMRKTDYHRLARYVPRERIDPEVLGVLNAIHEVSSSASLPEST